LNGRPVEILVPERLRKAHIGNRSNYFHDPHARPMGANLNLYAVRKGGEERPVEISLSPIETDAGLLVLAAVRDTSIRRAAQQAADEANRIKDEFLATLSHELRTPLTSILGWATILSSKALNTEESNRAIQSIIRSARQQTRLIDDLLDVSRIITGGLRLTFEPVALRAVVEAAIDTIRPAALAKSIELRIVLDSSDIVVAGDQARLQQIIWNLVSNAVRYTPTHGHIAITLERTNSTAQLVVTDSGCGM